MKFPIYFSLLIDTNFNSLNGLDFIKNLKMRISSFNSNKIDFFAILDSDFENNFVSLLKGLFPNGGRYRIFFDTIETSENSFLSYCQKIISICENIEQNDEKIDEKKEGNLQLTTEFFKNMVLNESEYNFENEEEDDSEDKTYEDDSTETDDSMENFIVRSSEEEEEEEEEEEIEEIDTEKPLPKQKIPISERRKVILKKNIQKF